LLLPSWLVVSVPLNLLRLLGRQTALLLLLLLLPWLSPMKHPLLLLLLPLLWL
jgi:hypothetical protein